MTKRLLILTDPFGKPAYGPRLRYLCDYLGHQGYAIDVYTEQFESYNFAHEYPIYEMPIRQGRISWALRTLWSLLTDYRNRHFSKWLQKETADKKYDIVFCTTFSTFPLRAANDVAKAKNIPLVIDLRDIDEQVPGAQYQYHRGWWTIPFRNWYRNVNIRRRNHILPQASAITTVSPWHVDYIKKFNKNVHLVYNGYAPELFVPQDVKNSEFLITYIGRIYEFQDTKLIEQAVAELPELKIRLNWHTPAHNPIPNTEVPAEIQRSSIMLVLTNPAAHGMMTTKFYEAFGCEKPVLCIPSDEGVLSQTIRDTNAGLASSNIEEIKTFIREKYTEWEAAGYTRQKITNREFFSRAYQAKKVMQILDDLQ